MKRIFSLILVLMAVQMMFAAKVTVTNTSDDVDEKGSLRWACKTATANDTIVFKFGTKGDKTIRISSYLTTEASIDGSTWADSIIIEGTNKKANSSDDGFQGVGAFVKNIVVKNCYAGFHVLTSTAKSNAFYDCIASNCIMGFYCNNSKDVSIIRCKSLNNDNYGISSGSTVLETIEDCHITGNKKAGIYGQAKNITGCRIYSNGVGIDVVYNSDLIEDCVISGNTTYGIHVSGKVKKISNNVIGLTEDQKDVFSNDNGIYIQGSGVDILSGNVISGNLKDGINSSLKGSDIGVFMGNYIGTNKYFVSDPKFGNGANGYYPSSSSSYPKFSRNYFGNNAENGIKGSFSGTISFEDCYFGITPDGDPMPNGIDGLNVGSSNMTFKNCHVGYNEGSGINVTRGTVTVNGGEFIGNKEMGLSLLSGNPNFTVEDAIFDSNGNSAISFDNKGYLTSSLISNTKFLHTNKAYPAYSTTNPYPAPEFTSCKMTEKTIDIVVKVDTAAKAKIELFYTSQGEQTAEMLVDSFYTKNDGTLSISLDKSKFAGKSIIGFTATATYGGKYTSPLSDVVCPEMGKVDLKSTEFYVKVDGYGDGSSWEKAMSPQTFAYYLPQVKDGSTFHVAEGTYYPMYGSGMKLTYGPFAQYTIKSNVTIKGGYPANAKKGSVSDPKNHSTVFSGDFMNDDDFIVKYESGDSVAYYLNTDDDCSNLFYVEKTQSLFFDGVEIRGGRTGVNYADKNAHFYVNRSSFLLNSSQSIYCSKNNSVLKIENSVFDKCNCLDLNDGDTLVVYGSKFTRCGVGPGLNSLKIGRLESNTSKGYVLLDSIEYIHNYGEIEANGSYESFHVKNSIFEDNVDNMYLLQLNLRANALLIEDCKSFGNKGYIYLFESALFRNCNFERNQNSYLINNNGSIGIGECKFENCTFKENVSDYLLNCGNCAVSVSNCSFSSNKSMYLGFFSHLKISGTQFVENECDYLFGSDSIYAVNSSIRNNTAKYGNTFSEYQFWKNDTIAGNVMDKVIFANVATVEDCFIENNESDGIVVCTQDSLYVFNSTFAGNTCQHIACSNGNNPSTKYTFKNNTIVNNHKNKSGSNSLIEMNSGITPDFQNNTIISNYGWDASLSSLSQKAKFIGNIIYLSRDNGMCFIYSNDLSDVKYNIISQVGGPNSLRSLDETNIVLSDIKTQNEVFSSIFDGNIESEVFVPSLKDNGGFTPTVALKSDKLSDGKSIRFPRLDDVLTDQRGESRLDNTCMGAYEISKIDTVVVRDTIVLGETYAFNDKEITPEKIGWLHDTMIVKKGNIEIPYILDLCVKPKKSSYYYVKKVAEGNGTGSSWKNAMSGEDFAFALPFAAGGTKFYFAEGVYNPIYDAKGEKTEKSTSLCYRINSNVTFVGGYPANAQIGATADPENHPTIFSGDIKGDDKVVKGVDENGRLKLTYSNRGDNSEQLFVLQGKSVTFNNVNFEGATSYGIIDSGNNARFEGKNLSFRNCGYAVYYPSNDAVVFIEGSTFENNKSGCLYTTNAWNTNISTCSFTGNTGYIAYSTSEGMMSFDHVSVIGNNAQIYSSNKVDFKISNSEFIDNDNYGSLIFMLNNDKVSQITNSLFKENKNQILEFKSNTSLDIDSCSFIGNTNRVLYAVSGSKTSIGRSVFEKNILPAVGDKKGELILSEESVGIKTSSFFDNECGNLAYMSSVDVENSTFVKNDVNSIIYQSADGDKFRLVNNTIISNKISSYPLYAHLNSYLHGNIVLGNKLEGKVLSDKKYDEFELSVIHDIQEFEFNLMDIIRKNPQTSEDDDISTYIPDNSTNLLVKPREITIQKGYNNCKACEYATDNSEEYYLTNLFDGTLDSKTGTFTPTIKNNGGSTPTVALKFDKLSDGTTIRFPRLENVLTDQRGVSRFDETCMGAYELGCGSDTTFTTDTIYVGEKIYGQTFTKVGVHDSIFETLTSSLDCDSVVMHKVVVKPDPKTLNYYVKTKKVGDGDGRDWDNAMDGTDFATYLPLAPDGVTFYVAAGTYNPVYGVNLNVPSKTSDLCYALNSNVTIRGGYPANATGKDVPSEPKKYETIFDGDIKGDDKIDKSKAEDGYPSLERTNLKDNVSNMFLSNASIKQNVEISGVVVKNTATNAYCFVSGNKNLVLRQDSCIYTAGVVNMPITNANLEVYSCGVLSNVSNYVFNIPTTSKVILDSINVVDSRCTSIIYAPSCKTISVSNSQFENSVVTSNGFYAGDSEGTEFRLQNVAFSNNNGTLAYLYGSSNAYIDSCSFMNNVNGSSFVYAPLSNNNVFALTNSKFENNNYEKLLYVYADTVISRNCIFSSNKLTDNLLYEQLNDNNKLIQIEQSSFVNNSCGDCLVHTYADSVVVLNSIFDNNTSSSLLVDRNGRTRRSFLNNAFVNNTSSGNLYEFTASGAVSKFVNNTISKNTIGDNIFLLYDHPLYLYNNTIVGNVVKNKKGALLQCDFYHSWADLYGNIIVGNSVAEGKTEYLAIRGNSKKKYNILSFSLSDTTLASACHDAPDATNIISVFDPTNIDCDNIKEYVDKVNKNPEVLLSDIFEGTYDKKTNLFTPVIDYYGGLTPTIALRADQLSDGTSIRFPIEETIAETDQRGVSRLDETCMGAYEMRCGSDTTFTTDTIYVGEKIYGQTFTKVGVHDSIFETLTSSKDCDSVVMHKVVVKPDPKTLNYYVKTKKVGDGDGRDWDNAMDGDDFAMYLPLAPDGAIFYVAAGTYKPVFDTYLNKESNTRILCYTVNSDVTIKGGYSDKATGTNVVNEPDKYKTIFDGDIVGNDVIDETLEEDGYPALTRTNGEDNVYYLFNVGNYGKANVNEFTLDGVVCRNAIQYVLHNQTDASVSLSNVNISSNSGPVIYGFGDVNIRKSVLSKNNTYNVINAKGNNISIVNTTIENNRTSSPFISISSEEDVYVNFDSVSYLNNRILDILDNSNCDLSVSNSHFSGNYAYSSSYFAYVKQIKSHDNVFEKNRGNYGIYNAVGGITLKNDSFNANVSDFIVYSNEDDVEVRNSAFIENEIGSGIAGNGCVRGKNVLITDSKIEGNVKKSVQYNDAVIADERCVAVRDTVKNNDLVGIFRGNLLKIDSCIVTDNHSQIAFCYGSNEYEGCDTITNSVFTGNRTTFSGGRDSSLFSLNVYSDSTKNVFFYQNILTSNSGMGLMELGGRNVLLEKNTFAQNKTKGVCNFETMDLVLKNNTFASNDCQILVYCQGVEFGKTMNSVIAYNNTFVGNDASQQKTIFDNISKSVIVGNIFADNFLMNFENSEFVNNALLNTTEVDIPAEVKSTNVFDDDLTSLFNGTYDLTTGAFTPEVKNNGGFTPTVALKKDVLSDGTSIRFPRLETVLTDQRGVERFDETCMGAYELRCNPVETELKDTVLVGSPYTFNGKNLDDVCQKVGSYHYSETFKSAAGCDSVVNLSLAVRPQKNENGYYVKVDGTGDGSDWDNAMSPKDFAEYLPLVYDGETFHIAAGTYKSTYVDPELGRMYNINSSVTLIGGYPDTVTTVGVPPMPETFATILTANGKKTDYINVYKDRPGDYSVSGLEDNDSILIRVNGTPTVSIFGITLSGVKSDNYGAVTMNDGGTLNMDKCAIVKNNASGVVASNAKINLNSTLAYNNVTKDGAVFRLTQSDLKVEYSSFYENVSSGESSESKGAVADLTESKVIFTNNTVANNWADMGTVFALSSSQVSLLNNTLVGNQSIAKEPKGSFVSASDSKSKVTLFGNLIVGNGAQPVDGAAIESEGYNIFSTDFQGLGVESDMFMGSVDYELVMDGTPMTGNSEVFIANVRDNGGFTPTMAVIESMFEGGKVVSIPAEQRKVDVDQREMVRKETSCVGAFEFPTYVNYFVKQSPVGDGTGRDWDNAMGDTTFFRYFSIVPTGATFHVAAGTYHPLEDRLYHTTSNKNYYSSRPLNVFGGYHPQAKEGAVADPSKYVTLLSADLKDDDVFVESDKDYTVMDFSNHMDNSSSVMTIVSKLAGDVQLKGLTFSGNYPQFRGSSAALSVSSVAPEVSVSLILDSCSFKKTYIGIYSGADSLIVRGCRFDSIDNLGFSHYPREEVSGVLVVENSSFTNMDNAIMVSASKGKVLLQNSTFSNTKELVGVRTTSYKKVVDLSLEMYHNTFAFSPKSYGGIEIPNYIQTIAKGNIFNTNILLTKDYDETNAMKPIVSDYNLFVEDPDTIYGAWTLGENDMLVAPSDLTGVLPGTMVEKRFNAVSTLEKPEDFTKVVALESDVLNEKYIRMPIEEAKVNADQIATERLDLTCMGAYEFFKGRDTVYVKSVDTVCYGLNYQRRGWDLQTETLPEGEYVYGRFLRGKIATDTIDTLTLHVNPFSKIMLDQLAVAPTLCHGSGYGEVSFIPRSVVSGSAAVYVKSENGDTLTSGVQLFNSAYKYNELPIGKFGISILSQTQCVVDTLFDIEVLDRDSLQALPGADNILTDCANEPNSELTISLIGFHPTMKFYHNGVEISDQTNNDELIYGDDAAVTASAELKLSSIPVGSHSITAVDVCDNSYLVKDFEVSVIPSQVLDMQLVDYTKETLACGLDSGFAKFHIMSGATSLFTLTSDNGYDYSLRVQGKDTVLILNDLTRGNYTALLKKESEDCSDSYSAELTINSPEPLFLSMTSNGAACAEGAVSVVAEGGTGEYTYHWTNPSGTKFMTKESGLNEASAGKYICVVEDETHCFSHPDSLAILPNVDDLSELHVDSVATKNITCFKGENGTIEVYFSTENKQQSVACIVTNDKTKEETKTAGTYEKLNGVLAIRTLGVGSYSYEVYYGTEGCRLDTNSFKGTFSISAKEVPFVMSPLSVFAPQTCVNPANGMIVNTATGWEDDYNAYLMTDAGGKHIMTPIVENGETKLYAGLLSGGSFYYLVEDACGSEMTTNTVSLTRYAPLSISDLSYTDSVTCARAKDAEISFSVSGGIGMNHLAFIDDKSFAENDIVSKDNGQGYHTVSYKSVVSGCKDSVGVKIRIAGPDTLAIKYTLNGNCLGSALLPEVSGESAPYTYLWSDGEKEINGTEKFPFDDMGEGKTYSLTVSDAHKCDTYTKSFTIPSAAELPTVSQKVYPESEKCHLGNDGKIIVKPSLSKKMDYAVIATIFYHKLDSKDSIANECVLDPNGEFSTPENIEPGYYRVTTRLGSMDCDMGVAPVTSVVHVDTLPPLKIQSEFTLTDHTCISPNGTAAFNIEGWTYTHVADIYSVGEDVELYRGNVRPSSVSNYVGAFDVTALPFGSYKVVVKDRCGNKDESESFDILHKPTFIQNIKTEKATCINEPNGVLDFEIQGWTLSHGCEFVKNDNAAEGRIVPVLPVKYDTLNKLAYFHVNTMPAGKWRIWVANECKEAFRLDTFVTVPGIEPYKVDLISKDSKLELTCPYDHDGIITLTVTGGYTETSFYGSSTTKVTYYGPTGEYIDSTVYVPDTSYMVVAKYDSLNPIVTYDTTYKFLSQETIQIEKDGVMVDTIIMHYDTIVNTKTTYPQLVDENGEFINDTIVSIDSFETIQRVPKIGQLDSLATSPIEYDQFTADPLGSNTGTYRYINLDAGTYRFTFKSALNGCTDKYDYDTQVTKPADVRLESQVLPISCSSYIDGEISLAPRRGGTSYSYYVGHDSTMTEYEKNRLYVEVDGKMVEHSINGVNEYRIDQLFDQSDIKTIKWSYNAYESSVWTPLDNIIFPDSSDITEETYYKGDAVIKTPVYSNTHLEKFWHGYMGDYFEANVVSIANLAPGYYSVLVEDAKNCQYHDTFEVKLPPRPLKIDSVKFDATLAECDPSKRQILAYASGGWGSYNFTFSDKSKVETTDAKHSDGFRGGEATYYDKNSMTGWGVSYFLDPGNYSVVVLDEQGCLVEYDKTFEVKTKFSLTMDSTRTKCPEDPTAKVVAHFVGSSAVPGMTYDVVEYVSPCSKDTLDDCREYTLDTLRKNMTPKNDTFMVDLTSLKMHSKTHGLFVYQNDQSHCGTYVQGTVVDTIPIFKSSRKSSLDVTCGGLENGQIELYVSGGSKPYKIQRNSAWKKGDELALYEDLDLIDTTFTLVLRDPKDTTYKKDTIIEQHFIRLSSLPADTFYFTVIDDKGCKSVMGDTASFDEKIIIKAPEKLEAEFASSLVCKEPSVTKGGNVFFQNIKGGVAPYTLSYNHDYLDTPVDDSEPIAQILDAKVGFKVDMKVTDANNCVVDSTVEFKPGELQIDMYDFWATSWYEYGDVVALIDVCGPEATFDSVSYVFYDEHGKVDPRIRMLDKRLYVYDLEGDKDAAAWVYRYGDDTKTMVPDAYFEKKFSLRADISKGQAKHLNFFKFEDSSIDVNNINDVRDALAKHTVLMKAYFLGCEYQIERKSPLGVINPNNKPNIDPIGQKYQIISFFASPNPFKLTDELTIKAEFSEMVNDAEIYIYQIDGKSSPDPIKIAPSELVPSDKEYVYERKFNVSDLFSSDIPDYIILLLKTGRDQKSTTLLYYGVNDSYWK